jgi:hypothetical protein
VPEEPVLSWLAERVEGFNISVVWRNLVRENIIITTETLHKTWSEYSHSTSTTTTTI